MAEVKEREVYTVAQLAERWSCSTDIVLKWAHDPKSPIRAFALNTPVGGKRKKETLRFRRADVLAWEAGQTAVRVEAPKADKPATEPPAWYNGKTHTKRRLNLKTQGRPGGDRGGAA